MTQSPPKKEIKTAAWKWLHEFDTRTWPQESVAVLDYVKNAVNLHGVEKASPQTSPENGEVAGLIHNAENVKNWCMRQNPTIASTLVIPTINALIQAAQQPAEGRTEYELVDLCLEGYRGDFNTAKHNVTCAIRALIAANVLKVKS